jgi:hypothetical protein
MQSSSQGEFIDPNIARQSYFGSLDFPHLFLCLRARHSRAAETTYHSSRPAPLIRQTSNMTESSPRVIVSIYR